MPGLKVRLAVFSGLAILIWPAAVHNHSLFFLVNGFRPELFSMPMLLLTSLADGFFLLMICFALYRWKREKFLPALAGFILAGIIVQTIKHFFPMPRPLHVFPESSVFLLGMKITQKTFPSGHAATALVMTRFLLTDERPFLNAAIIAAGLLAALSRVYIGVHFPLDILAGGMIGFFITDIMILLSAKLRKPPAEKLRHNILVSGLGILICLAYLFFYREKTESLVWLLNPLVCLLILFQLLMVFRDFRSRKPPVS